MEAVFLQIKSQGDANAAIWKRIDGRLAQSCLKDLKDLTDFELPTDSDSQAAIACLAPVVSVESSSHMNIDE
ncbi:hypothetical protein CROQUDRAFT_656102 [Cronartium quercuum f. sp. fusiforme G11]|uniref:Uncharacterized protein n=1 Tax=Cronartium quercuum f. sp. fusiforme G11 TaxID=708437 RepID=A0A9P6TCM7_9BASI|nr:hypothetical protein CROQUDRAFT_656102 [Cronartium quercuum f. sp. fusiforme G11]